MSGVTSAGQSSGLVAHYLLRNKLTKWCLDGDKDGNSYTLPCNEANQYQQWWYDKSYWTWNQTNTDRCLHHNLSTRRVTTWTWWQCTDVSNIWIWRHTGDLSVFLMQAAYSKWCLDSNFETDPSGVARKVFLSECNADDQGQRWYLDAV